MAEIANQLKERIGELAGGDSVDDIITLLSELPSQREREWELALTRLIEAAPDRRGDLKRIFETEEGATEDLTGVQFAAFFAFCTYQRRRGNIAEFGRLLELYEASFGDQPMYLHLRALHQKQLRTAASYQRAIEYADNAREHVDEGHEGVEHSYVTAVVSAIEEGYKNELSTDADVLLERAEATMDRIMTEPVYPKFHVTLGRIRALQGEYGAALRLINKGIDSEDDSKDSYALRVNSYRTHEVRVYLQKYQDQIESQQRKLESNVGEAVTKIEGLREESEAEIEELRSESQDQIKQLQAQTLQFLGFFAALLAVIISAVTIALEFTILSAASLILVLIGGLLIAFGAFTVILPVDRPVKRGGMLLLVGLFVTGIGFVIAAALEGVF